MATKKEIKEQLNIALSEIGKVKPWFDKDFKNWIFKHPNYPVEYAGDSKEEVIKNYPLYLQDFIEERLNENLNSLAEKETKGKGGKRKGAGRPIDTRKEEKVRVYLPLDIAKMLKDPTFIASLRALKQVFKHDCR